MKIFQNARDLMVRPYIRDMAVLSLYIVLTLAMTFPLILHMADSIYSSGTGDDRQVLYVLWYAKQALLNPSPNMTPDYTNYIYYPTGIHLSFITSPFNQFLGIPLQILFGLPATYNTIWLLSFVLGGFGTYLLVKYLTGNEVAAFFSGLVFAFAPYHFAHALGHMGATSIEWIPFCALYLIKMVQEKGIKNPIIAAVFLILVAASDSQYMVFTEIFAGFLLLFELVSKAYSAKTCNWEISRMLNDMKGLIVKFLIFGISALVVILPLNYTMISIAMSGNNYLQPTGSNVLRYSADLAGFLVPSSLHPLVGGWLQDHVYNHFTGNTAEYTTFIGYTVIFLSIFAVATRRKEKYVLFWGACAVAFLVLALGPVLHVMGETSFTSYGIVITLPYALLREIIPFLNNSQTPSRLDVIAILSFAVLSGYGLSTLLSRVCGKNGRTVTACLLIVLLLFEFQSMPAISRIDQPAFYREAGDDDGTYALLEIPATANYACGLYCEYYQTISNKPIVGGQIARRPADIFIFEKNTPVINELTFLEPMPDILIQNESLIGTSVFNYYNIKYIIVHTNFLDDQQVEFLENKINGALQFEVMAYPEDHIIVYRILNDTNPDTFMALRDGWYSLEAWNGVPGRWMANNSRLDIVCSESGIYQLSFEAGSVNKESELLVYVNDALVQAYKIDEMEWNETTPGRVMVNITLNEGKNVIKFHDTRPGIVPSEHNLWNDDRVLNIAVQNISLHRE